MKRESIHSYARYGRQIRGQLARLILAYSMSLAGVVLLLALPWPLKFLIDHVLAGDANALNIRFFPVDSPTSQVLVLAGAMLVLAVLAAVVLSAERILHARIRERFSFGLRDEMVQQVYRLSRFSRQAERSGELTMRLASDVEQVSRLFCKTMPTVLKYAGTTLLTLVTMFYINHLLGALAFLLASTLACVVIWYGPQVNQASTRKRQLEGEVSALTQETIHAIEHVQAMGLEAKSRELYLRKAAASLQAGVDEARAAVYLERTTQLVAGVAMACIAGAGGLMVVNGQMSLGTLTVCLAYMNALLKPVERINELTMSISRGLVRLNRVQAIFEAQTSISDAELSRVDSAEIAPLNMIECRSVSYRYPENSGPTVQDFSHQFVKGQASILVGPSGSGKSTLLRLLLRLLSPDQGVVFADGIDYRQLHATRLRSHFAVVLQDAHLFAGSIRDVLTELSPDADDSALRMALADVELLGYVDGLAKGLDSSMDESGSQLSGGQRTRLLLARALLSQRSVLILDEPFANIDDQSKRIIAGRLAQYKKRCILIVVTHETSLLDIADHVLYPVDWHAGAPAFKVAALSEAQGSEP